LLQIALILTDQGRGKEAIDYLENIAFRDKSLNKYDYRIQTRDLEKASALIDKKMYTGKNGAYIILSTYINDKKLKNTFAQRKAKNSKLRLLIEFKKNKPESKNFKKKEYEQFEIDAIELLKECLRRDDRDTFKKTCTNLADFYHEKKEKSENELKCYYLYIYEKNLFANKRDEIVTEWITQKKLKDLLKQYHLAELVDVLNGVDDERHLRGFFDTYIDYNNNNSDTREEKIIEKLRVQLIAVYTERDNLFELGEIEDKYTNYKEGSNIGKIKNEKSVEFIEKCFFKGEHFNRDDQVTFLSPDSILNKMHQNTKNFAKKVVGQSQIFSSDEQLKGILTVLRRWNSFTPTLASSVNPSKGGGYFFYFWHKEKPIGIVVDPGYDFLENFFSQGFRIGDIDAIIVSHAHPDHTDNFPSILSLYHELNDRLGKYYRDQLKKQRGDQPNKRDSNKKHLRLILSQGVFDQYNKLMQPSKESLEDIFVVQAKRSKDKGILCFEHEFDNDLTLNIEAFATSHKDLSSQSESLGFIFKIKNGGENRQIGYTSDARWSLDFSKKFYECQIVCAHLGSIVDIFKEEGFCILCSHCEEDKKCRECFECKKEGYKKGHPNKDKILMQARKQSHLYLSGLAMFFDDLLRNNNEMELALISEFGEELKGGIRMDLYNKFNDWFKIRSEGKARCIPGDIGVEIDLMNSDIFCSCCEKYKHRDKISPIAYGKEEAIFFVCDECKSVLSTHQIDEKLKEHYENGRKLELAK
jgi:ribonuclease BN (tRNA processing enzyme)